MTETSRIANQNAASFKQDHRKWICEALRANRNPATAGEIAILAGRLHLRFDKTAVSRRMKEMEIDGIVIRGDARLCTCELCKSRQLTWSLKLMPGQLFDVSPVKKW